MSAPSLTLRTEAELVRAHDLLVGMILNDGPTMPEGERGRMGACASVLCWALAHAHNQTFGNYLVKVEALAEAQGFELGPKP